MAPPRESDVFAACRVLQSRHGQAFFDDDVTSNADDGGWSQAFIGSSDSSTGDSGHNFGIHFDGDGDFAEVSPDFFSPRVSAMLFALHIGISKLENAPT